MPPGFFCNSLKNCPNPTKPLGPNGFLFDRLMTPTLKAAGSNPVGRTIERISEPYIVWGTVFVQTKRHSLP